MGVVKRVFIRNNADGTKTKRTSYTYRTLFGTKTESRTQIIGKPKGQKKKGLLRKLTGL
jgi:hypothetical protein